MRGKAILKKQSFMAASRLALMLDKLFPSPIPLIDFKQAGKGYKNLIDAKDAAQYVGKNVTVCSRIYGIRSTDKITQINLDAPFPNSPLTVIIFASSYSKFSQPLTEYYNDKNICVTGKIELYKGKAQIIVDNPERIKIVF